MAIDQIKQELLDALTEEDYKGVKAILEKNPDLVNMDCTSQSSVLMHVFMGTEKNNIDFKELIYFILTHEKFYLSYFADERYSNIRSIFKFGEPEILGYVIDNPAIVLCGRHLSYKYMVEVYNLNFLKLIENPEDKFLQKRVKDLEKMLSMVRKATINVLHSSIEPRLDNIDRFKLNQNDNLQSAKVKIQDMAKHIELLAGHIDEDVLFCNDFFEKIKELREAYYATSKPDKSDEDFYKIVHKGLLEGVQDKKNNEHLSTHSSSPESPSLLKKTPPKGRNNSPSQDPLEIQHNKSKGSFGEIHKQKLKKQQEDAQQEKGKVCDKHCNIF